MLDKNNMDNVKVKIVSDTRTTEMIEEVGLSAEFALAEPGVYEVGLNELGFPTGNAVIGATELPFDISLFTEILTAFIGAHNFIITVIDKEGASVTKTLTLIVE